MKLGWFYQIMMKEKNMEMLEKFNQKQFISVSLWTLTPYIQFVVLLIIKGIKLYKMVSSLDKKRFGLSTRLFKKVEIESIIKKFKYINFYDK